jgi:hypothetical protein
MLFLVAVASNFWTGLAAVFGALVGATAGGIVEWRLDRLRATRLARAGARLVIVEISTADSNLMDFEEGGGNRPQYVFSTECWSQYREVLVERLSVDEFRAVGQAIVDIGHAARHFPDSRDFPEANVWIAKFRQDLAAAYSALANLSGHDKLDDGEVINPRPWKPGQ